MFEIEFVVIEDANSETPVEVFAGRSYWQALEFKAVNYVDHEAKELGVDIARKWPDGSLDFDI